MLTKLFLFLLNFRKGDKAMLIRLYASEVLLGKVEFEKVPVKLQADVRAYLADMGYEV